MKYPKILIACPTYEGKDYIIDKWVENIKNISYPNFDYLIVDNSVNEEYYKKLESRGYNVVHVNRGKHSRDALSNAQNYIREKVLVEGYDYWLSVESDLLPPKNIVWKLLLHGKPVTGVIYYLGDWGPEKPHPACLFVLDKKESGLTGTRLVKPEELCNVVNTGLQQVHGMGLGCTLISRNILSRFKFWTDERFVDKHSDVYFYLDLQNAGVPVFVDTNIVVKHYASSWELVKDR